MANNRLHKFARTICLVATAMTALGMPLAPLPASAALLDIATVPLAKSAGAVNPNLLFLLDGSGSMAWEYLPDYLYSTGSTNFYACFDNGTEGSTAGKISERRTQCTLGDPPFMSPDFNKVYYNPDYVYKPGVNWDGTSKGDQSITAAKTDPYGIQAYDQLGNSVATRNLTTDYPDRVWCNTNSRATTDTTNCKKNSGYDYPSQAYSYYPSSGGTTGATGGSKSTRIDNPNGTTYTPRWVLGAPYYYRIKPTEYCSDPTLRTCIPATGPTGAYTYPAPVRFCKDPNSSASVSPLVDCQGLYNFSAGYTVPKFLGYVQTSTDGEKAYATITISDVGLAKGLTITGLKVNTTTIPLTAAVTVGAGESATVVAKRLHDNIGAIPTVNPPAPGFTFTKSYNNGNTVTLTATTASTLPNGATLTITGAAAGTTGSKAVWKLTVGSDTTGPKTYRVGNISIGGTPTTIVAADPIDFPDIDLTTAAGQSSAAQIISNAINNTGNGGYTATWSGNEVTITAAMVGADTRNLSVATPSTYAAIRPIGTIVVGSAAAGTTTYGIASVKVGTTLATSGTISANVDLSNTTGRAEAALAIAQGITANGYSATSSGNVITIYGNPGLVDNGKSVTATPSAAAKPKAKLVIASVSSTNSMTSLKVASYELLGTSVSGTGSTTNSRRTSLCNNITNRINSTTATNGGFTASGNCSSYYLTVTGPNSTVNDEQFVWSSSGVTIDTGATTRFSGGVAPMPITGTTPMSGGGNAVQLPTATSRIDNGTDAVGTIATVVTPFDYGMAPGGTSETRRNVGTFQRCDITPTADCAGLGAGKFPRTAVRTDCTTSTTHCTYAEEAKNFANWYAYYRTRMQSMKSAAGLAFSTLTESFRVGFNTIDNSSSTSTKYLAISEFNDTQKQSWFSKFHAVDPDQSTPLRGALATAGRMFSGKALTDPVQYACQQNFVLMTTDGYWNDGCTNIKDIAGNTIGNPDGQQGVARPYFDGYLGSTDTCQASSTSSSGTLADVAQYYYTTDIRNSTFTNCTGAPDKNGDTHDVCPNLVHGAGTDNLPSQHMTTYTLGLGVDGTIRYQSDYQTETSGDYFNIKNGTTNWPKPQANSQTGIDDLWHAAVNGRGRYFSSKNPASLADDVRTALTGMTAQLGTGAAAATSNLEPQEGDNFSYVASYTTQQWTGNLEARSIAITTGQTQEQAIWCIENVAANASKGTTACLGTLQAKVGAASDTRRIFLYDAADAAFNDGSKLRNFTYGSLTATEKAYFAPATLSQWPTLPALTQTATTAETLVNYLRGQTGFDRRATNTYQSYRTRNMTMGDAVNSQPVYVAKPKFSYADPAYATGVAGANFKSDNVGRTPMVFLGTNDGMLHAFNGVTGEELWAFVPSPMLPTMAKLADVDYENQHRFRVDGSPTVGDVCFSGCDDATNADWHTILVGGYSSGGRGYHALDITNPQYPKALWELTPTTDADFGLSYGNPIITKRPDGKWVVLLTSGYNNASPGSGEGVLYVVDPASGSILAKKSNSTGSAATPSGLSKIAAYIENANEDNTTTDVYGGDLLGNVWRFRLLADGTIAVAKIAELMNDSSQPQPITIKPILTTLDDAISTRYVIVATGKLLETNDTIDTTKQSLYGFEETYDTKGTIGISPRCVGCPHGARDQMTGQTLVETGTKDSEGRIQRAAGSTPIPPLPTETGIQGCYVDLPLPGERANIDMKLILGNIAMVSNVPNDDKCAAGGKSYMNFFDYKTCKATQSFELGDALAVGMVVLKLSSGYVVTATLSNDPTPQLVGGVPPPPGTVGFQGKRIGWRLLFD